MSTLTKLLLLSFVATTMAQNSSICDLCIVTVNITEDIVKANNMTLQFVETIVETLCELIGGGIIGQQCKDVIAIIQDIYNLLDLGYTAEQICTFLKFCPSQDIHKLPLYNNHYQNSNQQ